MLAAATYDLYQARDTLTTDGMTLIAVGFVSAFVVALLVVQWVIRFVQTHGFGVFAYYRIALGSIILALTYM